MRKRRAAAAVAAVLVIALAGAWWFMSGGSPDREPAAWLTAQDAAHRGQWTAGPARPENSLAAFREAAGNGYAVELDVQLSRDGRLVVFHDYELSRMTTATGDVADRTLTELQELSLLGGSETIPTLREALDTVGGRVPVFVEIKNEGEVGRLENAVAREVSAYDGPAAIMSFNPFSLARVAQAAPEVPRGQLAGALRDEDLALHEVVLLSNLLMNWKSRPDFIAYELTELPNVGTTLQKWRGRPLLGWTADSPAERGAGRSRCDAVICNPGALR
jgi:glycerophosphoryl diester phosphodiesterase